MPQQTVRQIVVTTKQGRLVHEIRLTITGSRWQARVVTLPNHIWVEPGGRRALVFESDNAERAEEMAASFIRRDSLARGHRVADPMHRADGAAPEREPARRRSGCYSVRFAPRKPPAAGGKRRARTASTENLSETGLFISTNAPLPPGSFLDIDVRLPGLAERLEGVVVWTRGHAVGSLDNGMGVRLLDPSLAYRAMIQTLG